MSGRCSPDWVANQAHLIGRASLALLIALGLAIAPIGRPAQAQTTLDDIARHVTDGISNLTNIIQDVTQITGNGFTFASLFKFHHHKAGAHAAPAGTPIASILQGMSCPVFADTSTLLTEDTCIWARMAGQATSSTAMAPPAKALDWHAGGQTEIAPGWFLGSALGVRTFWMQEGQASGQARSFDGAVIVKRVVGPLYLSAGFGVSSETQETLRSVAGAGTATMTSNSSSFSGGVRLRGAYEFVFERWYLRPRGDIDLAYINRSGLQETGPSIALTINPVSKFAVGLTPTLEIGARFDTNSGIVLRAYISGGASFLPDNRTPLSGTLAGVAYSETIIGPSAVANVEAGLQIYESKGWETRIDYRLRAADAFLSQEIGLRAAKHF